MGRRHEGRTCSMAPPAAATAIRARYCRISTFMPQASHSSAARMPHVPGAMPFPREGDQRWRPMWPRPLAGMKYEKLIELRDSSGKHWGDACALVTGPKANILYGWFRLQDGPSAEGLLFDVFSVAAETAGR